MADPVTLDPLAADIRQRFDALDRTVSDRTADEKLRLLIGEVVDGLTRDDTSEVGREIRFASGAPELIGTKYGRLGWTPADVEFAYDLLRAAVESGRSKRGPSEELTKTFTAVTEGRYMETALVRGQGHQQLEAMWRAGRFPSRVDYERAVRAMDTAESGFGS
jgi:hypothetical protein